ncbi:hypothetical protein, partial [Klebsiella pneumoniae]|uniref:hypothetical protein n=1 Tax=Klebsiella pneumoniae TaxID=573 RepID=UPI0039C0E269
MSNSKCESLLEFSVFIFLVWDYLRVIGFHEPRAVLTVLYDDFECRVSSDASWLYNVVADHR